MTPINLALFFLVCVVAAYPVVVMRRPDREALLARMAPFSVIGGVAAVLLGVLVLLQLRPVLGLLLSDPQGWILLGMIGVEILIGLLLVLLPPCRRLSGRSFPGLTSVQALLAIAGLALMAVALVDLV
jgi:hypothetical protein